MNPDCEKCGLLETSNGPVPDDGGDYTILVVGESPGHNEDLEGRPFIGKSGKFLRKVLKALGYPQDQTTFTNIVRCHPPDDDTKLKYVRCCYQSLPIKDNTKLVLLLGNVALKAVLGESRISTWSGVIVERDGIVYAPLYHPAYFDYKRNAAAQDDWIDALDAALLTAERGMEESADSHYEYIYPVCSLPDVYSMCEELLASPKISFDMEFASLDAYREDNRILAVSFANESKAWAVPIDHPDDLAPADDKIIDALCNTLEAHPYVMGHNIRMDQIQCDVMWDCHFDAKGDTMLASFLVESRKGIHGLKRLAGRYLGMFEYNRELTEFIAAHPEADPKKGGSYGKVSLDILLPYAAMDASATFLLDPIMQDLLSDKQRILYDELTIPTSNALRDMQVSGMAVDLDVADRYRRLYTHAMNDVLSNILKDPHVISYAAFRKNALTGVKKERYAFNPNSSPQKSAVLYDAKYYGLKPLGLTDTGKPSTKKDWLVPYEDECPLVHDLIRYGMFSKMISTYIAPIALGTKLSGDGRVRSSFNQHVVETGRLSSSSITRNLGINQQNIPAPEKEPDTILAYQPIKNMYTHTWENGCLMSADYSGMELRVFASLARCQDMIDIHTSGRDFHTMIGTLVSGKAYEDITKAERYRYKWASWTVIFGGSANTLTRIYNIPKKDAIRIIDTYYSMFPEVPEYLDECTRFARKHGYIETPFGFRRQLPNIYSSNHEERSEAEREAVNTPVQGGAGMITLIALTIIRQRMDEEHLRSMLVNTVHDSIVTDIYPEELGLVVDIQRTVMEDVIDYAARYMPNIDLDWLICPLKADIEVGSHYGSLEHVQTK